MGSSTEEWQDNGYGSGDTVTRVRGGARTSDIGAT
jgi:hypothetical protein